MKPADDALPLAGRQCRHLPAGTPAPDAAQVAAWLAALPGWSVRGTALVKQFGFPDYGRTMGFVNAVAWIAQQQDHHPDMVVGYDRCEVAFSTHSTGGLSVNDFICAARVEALL